MKTKKISMQKIKEILRLKYGADLSSRQISRSLNVSTGAISKYLNRADAAGIGWPLPDSMTEQEVLAILQPSRKPRKDTVTVFAEPDFNAIHDELGTKGMTRQLLWEEYTQDHPSNHYSYSRFTVLFKRWQGSRQLSMRQTHLAGEKMFVDYCGPTMDVINPQTGEVRTAQIFVSVLGASSYTFVEATWSQSLPDWIGSHVRAFNFFGGVPEVVVPDNLKSAVSKACRYDPDLNPTYQQLAEHYNVAVIPARPYKPKDKSKAEVAVQVVERWIMMRLRKQPFFTLASLNQAIRFLLADLNNRPFKKRPGSRQSQFESIDKPALRPLPPSPYEYLEVKKARVHLDYHVEYDGHFYSVPYQLVKQNVMIHASRTTLTINHQGKQVAHHPRAFKHGHTTDTTHMAKAHLKHQEWSPQRFVLWATRIGAYTTLVVEHQLAGRRHPEHGYRACLGLLNLTKKYGQERLEAACRRAHYINAMTYKNIASILSKGLDNLPMDDGDADKQISLPLNHDNVRGAKYYH